MRWLAPGSGRTLSTAALVLVFAAASFPSASCGSRVWAQDVIDAVVSLNDGARVTNSPTVQVKIRLGHPAPPGLEMALSTDPETTGAWRPFLESLPLELPAGDGEKRVLVRLRDAAGKDCGSLRASIVVDTTPPEAKVRVPERVAAGSVTLMSDVPDAVAMQWTEDATQWGPWMPYLQPRDIALSAGNGPKTVLVRYRDEAGNVSKPAVLRVEVAADAAAPSAPLRQVLVTAEPGKGDRLAVTLWISHTGFWEMSVQVDQDKPLPHEPFAATKLLEIPRTGGAHRIRLTFFDASGAESPVDVAFQEGDVVKPAAAPAPEASTPQLGWVSLQAGVLPRGVAFQAMVPSGLRKITSDPLSLTRLSLACEILDPLYGQVAMEFASGGDLRVFGGSLDLGARVLRVGSLDVAVEAGLLYSDLHVTLSDFGSFDSGLGFRAGVHGQWSLTERWSMEATVDYRESSYHFSETTVSGDRQARLHTAGLLLGVSLKF